MKRLYVIGLLCVFSLMAVGAVYAFGPRHVGPGPEAFAGCGPCMGFGPKTWASLDLSKEQMDKMWQLRERFRNETERLRYELFQKRVELKGLYADPATDKATLLAKEKEISGLRQALHDKMVQLKIEQRAILTPEQLKQLKDTPYGHGFGRGFGAAGFMHEGMGYGPCGW